MAETAFEKNFKMFIIIGVLLFTAALENTQGQDVSVALNYNSQSSAFRSGDFVNLNRMQYLKNIQNYEENIEDFKKRYAEGVNAIGLQQTMLSNIVEQTEQRLNPLQVSGGLYKTCITKYRSTQTVDYVKRTIASCMLVASNQINSMTNGLVNNKNNLHSYYTNNFEKGISDCGTKFDNTTANYTTCVTSVISTTNAYTVSNQKTFGTDMDLADCTFKANIKKAWGCSLGVHSQTMTSIAQSDILIDRCILGLDEITCKPCEHVNTCPNVYELNLSEVDYKNRTMVNPFYGRDNRTDCFLIRVYKLQ